MEFRLEPDISDEEASRLIGTNVKKAGAKESEWQDSTTQTLTIDTEDGEDDPFTARLLTFEVRINAMLVLVAYTFLHIICLLECINFYLVLKTSWNTVPKFDLFFKR